MRKVAVLQPNYIPWKGYFDIIHDVDEFIFYIDVQYTKNDWRNRNQIMVNNERIWLTIPVGSNEHRQIFEVVMSDKKWQKKHYATLEMAYHKSPYWNRYKDFIEYVYLEKKWDSLYELDRFLIEKISNDYLRCNTVFSDSFDYESHGVKSEKLLSLLRSAQTEIYVSGSAAKDYINEAEYKENGITVIWKNYDGYPEYPQMSSEFSHNVTVLDLLFNVGDNAPYYIWGWREEKV